MIRFLLLAILVLVIARAFWRVVDGIMDAAGSGDRRPAKPSVKLVKDPVCGTFVPPNPALSVVSHGTTQYFCSEECRSKFRS